MRYEVNECCGCAVPGYPCLGDGCSMRHVPRYVCDRCGEDDIPEEDIYHIKDDERDLCWDCYYRENPEFDEDEED